MTLADGTKPKDEVHGTLASYRSLSHAQALSNAQDAAIEWGLQQLQRRLSTHDPPLETEKDRDAAFDKWAQSKSRQGDNWSYTISKDDEVLIVKAEMDDDQGSESDDGGTGGSKWKGN